MRPRRLLVPRDTGNVLDLAVQERTLAILTFQQGTDWITFKSRFLERDAQQRFFVLDYQTVNGDALPPLQSGQYVGLSFRQRSRKILFATVVEAKGHYVLEDKSTVPAIRYRWPNSMTELQRRAYYRTPVPESMMLLASLWSGGARARPAAQAATLEVITGDLADISCGGAMVRLHQPNPPTWEDNSILGLELQMPDGRAPICVDVRFRGLRPEPTSRIGAAVQFVGLEVAPEGQAILERLASSVQRLHRLSIAAGQCDWHRNSRT
jgi:c-di-GMP-binding flagellar brake protein YcgR